MAQFAIKFVALATLCSVIGAYETLYQQGDIQIGGIFDLHEMVVIEPSEIVPFRSAKCRRKYNENVFLAEAMIYTINRANERQFNSTGEATNFGFNIQGTCNDAQDNMLYALNVHTNLEAALNASGDDGGGDHIAGLVGPAKDAAANSVASLFRLYRVPVVSYAATSASLANRFRFPSFFRTVYADDRQGAAIARLLGRLGWTYVSALGSDDHVGREGVRDLKRRLPAQTCVAAERYYAGAERLADALAELRRGADERANLTANSTVLFADAERALTFFDSPDIDQRADMTWIGVDQWTHLAADHCTGECARALNGALGLRTPVSLAWRRNFTSYLLSNLPQRLLENVWLRRYYCAKCVNISQDGNCTADLIHNNLTTAECGARVNLDKIIMGLHRISNVVMATQAILSAVDNMPLPDGYDETAPPEDGSSTSKRLYEYMVKAISGVNVTTETGELARFDELGNLQSANFDVMNVRLASTGDEQQLLETVAVGHWRDGGGLRLNESRIVWQQGAQSTSGCYRRCEPGERVVYGPERCCWKCEACPAGTQSSEFMSTECARCPVHHHVTNTSDGCLSNKIGYFSPDDLLGAIVLSLHILGEAATLLAAVVTVVCRKHQLFNDVHTLKALVVLNCALGFGTGFVYLLEPTAFHCSAIRVGWLVTILGHSLTALLTAEIGRNLAARVTARLPRIPADCCAHVIYACVMCAATASYAGVYWQLPTDTRLIDMQAVSGNPQLTDLTALTCGGGATQLALFVGCLAPPLSVWLTAIACIYRRRSRDDDGDSRRRRAAEDERRQSVCWKARRLASEHVLRSSYLCALVFAALAPLYVTTSDPSIGSFILLLAAFAGNSAVLGLYLAPRLRRASFAPSRSRQNSALKDVYIISRSVIQRLGRPSDRPSTSSGEQTTQAISQNEAGSSCLRR